MEHQDGVSIVISTAGNRRGAGPRCWVQQATSCPAPAGRLTTTVTTFSAHKVAPPMPAGDLSLGSPSLMPRWGK